MMKHAILMIALLGLSACQTRPMVAAAEPAIEAAVEPARPEWQNVAVDQDLPRIDQLRTVWTAALAQARPRFRRQLAADARLFDPAAALPRPAPAPGSYECRVFRVGATTARARAFQTFGPFFCHIGVDGDRLSLTRQTGVQRPGGYLWDDTQANRMIFLGAVAQGSEDVPPPYGQNRARDVAGVFQRIGPLRFRLVTPSVGSDTMLEITELVPAPVQPDE